MVGDPAGAAEMVCAAHDELVSELGDGRVAKFTEVG